MKKGLNQFRAFFFIKILSKKELKSINLYVTNIKCFKLNETNTKSPKPSNKKHS